MEPQLKRDLGVLLSGANFATCAFMTAMGSYLGVISLFIGIFLWKMRDYEGEEE
jgi:hypothetical protein